MTDRSGNVIPFASRKPEPAETRESGKPKPRKPSPAQSRWLRLGLTQPGGKLPLFYEDGREVDAKTVKSCVREGWAEPWIRNPIKPDWLVCRLTPVGREAVDRADA